ncbi:MAG: hypothetical protein A2W00_04575 [Candidatus Eisenbacteria bacterium RBG_16_71_46]|nr:MAG: hypothetical protein A2W00_04575 [Candidatus Eisenbacteria bacterium RBG_16_71_46]
MLEELFSRLFSTPAGKTGAAVEMVIDTCCSCGITFAYPLVLYKQRVKDGDHFFCPNGHSLHYGQGENEKLKKEIAALKRQTERLNSSLKFEQEWNERQKRSRAALRGVVTRLKNRAAQGVCPCCDQYFADLHAHMQQEHPEYEAQVEPGQDLPDDPVSTTVAGPGRRAKSHA